MAKKKTTTRKPKATKPATTQTAFIEPETTGGEPKVNKSALIRAYLTEHPTAKAKEVIEAFAAQGVVVSVPNYQGAKQSMTKKPGKKTSGLGPRKPRAAHHESNGDSLSAALSLVESVGTLDGAITLLERLKAVR